MAPVAIGLVQWLKWRCHDPILVYYQLYQEALPEFAPLRRLLGAMLQEVAYWPRPVTVSRIGQHPESNSLIRATIQLWKKTSIPDLPATTGLGFILSCADVCPDMLLISHIAFALGITTIVHCPAWGTLVLHPCHPKTVTIFAYHYDAFRRHYSVMLEAPNLENARTLTEGDPLIYTLSGFGIGQ
jgi:hypothetical protein